MLFSLGMSWAGTRQFIVWMQRLRWGQHVRQYGPDIHMHKQGTPTMGGAVFAGVALVVAALGVPRIPEAGFVLTAVASFGAIGLLDDLLKFARRDSLGLRARDKFGLQLLAATALYGLLPDPTHEILLPGLNGVWTLEGAALFAWMFLVFSGTTHAFNLTDGLDGLAAGVSLIALSCLALLAVWLNQPAVAAVLGTFGAALVGFFWFNRHPAKIFMGDTGSFSIGGAVAGGALVLGAELYLALFALVPVLETLSVAMQLTSYRLTRRRIFKIAPLHHHFEAAKGVDYAFVLPNLEWSETTITARFWAVAALGGALGLALFLL